MNYNQILTLFLQGTIVAFVILLLFRLRKKLGLGVLYACLGLFQFVQVLVFILNTVFDSKISKFLVSPGSSVIITITLFSLLIIYIKEDANETKKMIFAILIVNVLISVLLVAFGWNMKEYYMENSLSSPNHYIFSPRILIVGNLVLFLDSLLLIIIFEFISKKTKFLFIQILVTMLLVVTIDTLLFSTITFWKLENLGSIIQSGLISKNSFAFYYSIVFYLYFKFLDETDKDLVYFKINDVFKPLTYKQKFEAALTNITKSEEMFRLITNNSNDIICLLDLDGIYKYVSPSIKTILGYNQSDFIGKNIFKIVHKDDLIELKKNIDNQSFKNKNNTYTIRLLHTNGHYLWIEYTIAPIYEDNKIISFVSSARDVTKRVIADQQFKKSSQLLKIREHFLNESSKIAKIGFAEYNDEIQSFTWSDYLYTLFGVEQTDKLPTQEEFISFFDDASKQKIKKGIENLYAEGKPIQEELKAINTTSEEIWMAVIINPIYNNNNKIIGRRAVIQNITDYKNAQQELVESKHEIENSLSLLQEKEDSLKQTSKIAKIGYWEYNIKSESFTLSNYVYTIYGLDPKNKIPSREEMLSFYDKNSREKYETATQHLELNGIPCDLELKLINTKKEEIWVRVVVQLIRDKNNNITGKQGIIQNITETKKARLALEKSNLEIKNSIKLIEQKERSLQETRKIAQLGYLEYIYETESYIWTDYMYTIFGLEPNSEIPKREELMALHDEESFVKLKIATEKLETEGTPYDIELKLINFKNEEVWIRTVAHLIYNNNNEVIGRSGIFRDITAYKINQIKLESSLKQLEQKDIALKESNKIANIGYWEYYFEDENISSSNYVYKIYGLEPNQEIPKREEIMKLYDKPSLEKLKEANTNLMTYGKPYDIETKLTNFKNEEVWSRNIVQPIFNSNNKIIGRRGLIQNITEYKKTQIALETSLELLAKKELSLKDSSKMAGIGYIEYDYNLNKYTDYSEYIYTIFGLNLGEELTTKDEALTYFDEESKVKYLQALSDVKSGKISDVELKGKNRKNEDIWIRSVSSPIFNHKNEVIKRRVVLQDIRNYKKTQQELQKSLQLLKQKDLSLKDSSRIAGIGFAEYNYKNNAYTASKYIFDLFGVDYNDKLSEKDLVHFFDRESQLKYIQAIEDFRKNGTNYDIELKGKNQKNEDIWLRSVGSPIYNDKGDELLGRRIVLQDIKNYKKNQLELEKSKQELQNSLDLIKDKDDTLKESNKIANIGYWEYDFNNDTFVWSDYIYKIFGLNPQQKIPSRESLIDYYDEESKEKIKVATQNLITHEVPYDIELRLINANNEETWTRNVVHLVFNHKNEVIARRGLMQNITAYKKAQKEIKESFKLLERRKFAIDEASKIAKIGYYEYDVATDNLIWSEHLYRIYGLDPNKPVPYINEIFSLIDKESIPIVKQAIEDLKQKGKPYDIEFKVLNKKKNKEVWVRSVTQPVYNNNNKIIGRRGVVQDITTQRNNQIELEKKNKEIINSLKLLERSEYSKNEASKVAKIGYHEYYTITKTFYWSDYMYTIFGVEAGQKIPKREELLELFLNESRKKLIKATNDLETYGIPYDLELKLINFKGEDAWLRISNHPIYDTNKTKIIGRRGVAQDITERKKIEEEHLKVKKDYIRLFDNATISIWNEDLTLLFKEISRLKKLKIKNIAVYLEQNPELLFTLINKIKVKYVNKATLKLFKAQNEQEFFKNLSLTFGDEAEKVFIKLIEAVWNNADTFTSEVKYKTIEGDQFTAILSVAIPKTIKEQKTVPVSIQSIQSIKDAEFALKESLTKLKEAQKLGRLGNFEVNPITEQFTWSDEIYNIFDFDPKNGLPSYEAILNTVHPDDLEYHNQKIDDALYKGIPFDFEFRIITPKKVEKHLRLICELVKNDQGKVILLKGINQDITEHKKIINEIEKTQEMYRLVTDNTNDLICLHDIDGRIIYISPSVTELLGYDNLEYSRPFIDIIHYDEQDKVKEHIKLSSKNSNFKKPIDFRARHTDGHFIWFEALTSSAYTENDKNMFVTIARDITESVLIEEEIKEYQESLQKLTTEITLVEENQKKEIATNIHDHLSQSLVISNMKVKELKQKENLKEINEELNFIEEHITDALANSRKITSELSPPILYQFGIIEALYWLLENIENKHKIKCDINNNVESFKLDDVSSILLYRSIQEIINNTIKYAQATLITLELRKKKNGLEFVIKDNGKGFDVGKLNNLRNQNGSGFGLFTVKERIRNIRGNFKITSKIEKGTSVNIFIPLKNE